MKALAYNDNPEQTPNFEIIVLLGVLPSGFGKEEIEALKPFNARVMTYNYLIKHAETSYKEYLDAQEKVTKIQTIIDSL